MTADLAGLAMAAILAGVALTALSGAGQVRKRLSRQVPDPRAAPDPPAARGRPGPGQAAPAELGDAAMMLELIGAMLDAGAGLGRSLELVAMVAAAEFSVPLRPVVSALAIGADWETAWHSSGIRSPKLIVLRDALGFAALTGAPSSAILYAQAARIRREHFRAAEKQAAALSVRLVIPLGLCSLPAFLCLGVAPVLLALLPA